MKTVKLFLYITLIAYYVGVVHAEDAIPANTQSHYPPGDLRRCYTPRNKDVLRLEVIPGGGWDNLRNKDAAMVMKLNYSKCLTTEDGEFLLPDGIYTIPRKSSKVDQYADIFMHWNNYTSTLSNSINVHSGINLGFFSVSGKFSREYENIKSRQYFDKSVTTRVQVRYVRYTAKTRPDLAIDDAFSARLREIAAHIEMNRTAHATYESQLVVRDFGTHVITSVDIGAALVQVDHVKEDFVRKSDQDKHATKVSVSVSVLGIFSAGFEHSHSTSKSLVDQYLSNRTSSHIFTYGGPVFRPGNYTALNWSMSIDNNMVALDRSGDPIFFLVTPSNLPHLPQATVYKVRDYIKAAVKQYYQQNTYPGCTDKDSPNFSFMANQDDGSCHMLSNNFTFGGVYQTCSGSGFTDLCKGMRQINPLTGTYSCPEEYEAIQLQNVSIHATAAVPAKCVKHRGYNYCRRVYGSDAYASYFAYWCAATGHVDHNQGLLFGGLYTPTTANPVTQARSCPSRFYPLHILSGLVVCASDEYERGLKYSLPFAGFFSCITGNPFSLERPFSVQSSDEKHSMMAYMINQGSYSWPRKCPDGFSEHLAVVDNTCQVYYCIKTGALSHQGLPKIKLPPFMELPQDFYNVKEADYVFSDDGTIWTSLKEAGKLGIAEYPETGSTNGDKGQGNHSNAGSLSITATVLIAVGSTLAAVVIVTVVYTVWKKRNARYRLRDPWDQRQSKTDHDFIFADNRSGSYGGCQDRMTVTQT